MAMTLAAVPEMMLHKGQLISEDDAGLSTAPASDPNSSESEEEHIVEYGHHSFPTWKTQSFESETPEKSLKMHLFEHGSPNREEEEEESNLPASAAPEEDASLEEDLDRKLAAMKKATEHLNEMAKMHAFAAACAYRQVPSTPPGMPAPAAPAAAASAVPQGLGFLQAPAMPVAMPQPMMLPWMQMQMMMPPHLTQQMPTTASASTAAPNGVAAAQQAAREISSDPSKTTLMWKNLPNNFTRDELLELMDAQGFAGSYNFFYAPVDFTSGALVGYAFVNFVSLKEANRFIIHFQGFSAWGLRSEKVAEVQWSSCQGLEEHVERYRNSPVMHPDVSEEKRPVLFVNGVRVQFPKPTRKLRAPHLKECRRRD